MTLQDSGKREEFSTGAVRDTQENKGRCDLLPLDCLSKKYANDPVILLLDKFEQSGNFKFIEDAMECFIAKWLPDVETSILELSVHFQEGAAKYGDNNWKKGLPVSRYISSAIRHYMQFSRGDRKEPHHRSFIWNLTAIIWTCKHLPQMNDYAAHIQATNTPRQCGKTFQQALQAEFNSLANMPHEEVFSRQAIKGLDDEILNGFNPTCVIVHIPKK